ncbi:MAG: DUF459 domain-containing protein [Parvibaculum sp.]|nr:DUF459 domain-containing protein [Parvibaculum sp.]
MAGRAIAILKARHENGHRRRLLLLAFGLPLIAVFWFGAVRAEPMRLAPASLESAALTIEDTATAPAATVPAPNRTSYNVVVLGDSLGDGVWAGLYHVLRKDKRFKIIKKSRVATGFSRHDYYDWNVAVRDIALEMRIDIAVVVMGTNDRQAIVEDGKRHALFDSDWRKIYTQRVDNFTATLKSTGALIYWVELPVMRSARFGADMESFNEIFEERAQANGVAFVTTGGLATGADGGYTAYGEDRFGRTRLLRADDGIHFTMAGYELIGDKVSDAILRDAGSGAALQVASAPAVRDTAIALRGDDAPVVVAEKVPGYDMADRRPGRTDDWLWLGATN